MSVTLSNEQFEMIVNTVFDLAFDSTTEGYNGEYLNDRDIPRRKSEKRDILQMTKTMADNFSNKSTKYFINGLEVYEDEFQAKMDKIYQDDFTKNSQNGFTTYITDFKSWLDK